jgi:hypothetical protein
MKSSVVWNKLFVASWKSTDVSEEYFHFQRRITSQAGNQHEVVITLVSCLSYSSTPKIETTFSSELSVDFQRATRRYILEDGTVNENVVLLVASNNRLTVHGAPVFIVLRQLRESRHCISRFPSIRAWNLVRVGGLVNLSPPHRSNTSRHSNYNIKALSVGSFTYYCFKAKPPFSNRLSHDTRNVYNIIMPQVFRSEYVTCHHIYFSIFYVVDYCTALPVSGLYRVQL